MGRKWGVGVEVMVKKYRVHLAEEEQEELRRPGSPGIGLRLVPRLRGSNVQRDSGYAAI